MEDNIQSFVDLKKKNFSKKTNKHALFILIHKFSNQASNFNVTELKLLRVLTKSFVVEHRMVLSISITIEPSRE